MYKILTMKQNYIPTDILCNIFNFILQQTSNSLYEYNIDSENKLVISLASVCKLWRNLILKHFEITILFQNENLRNYPFYLLSNYKKIKIKFNGDLKLLYKSLCDMNLQLNPEISKFDNNLISFPETKSYSVLLDLRNTKPYEGKQIYVEIRNDMKKKIFM